MLLPQSSAFAALKNRLNSVSAIGYLHMAPRTYVSQSRNTSVVEAISSMNHHRQKSTETHVPPFSAPAPSSTSSFDRTSRLKGRDEGGIRWNELLEKFRSVQDKARRAQRPTDLDDGLSMLDLRAGEGVDVRAIKNVSQVPVAVANRDIPPIVGTQAAAQRSKASLGKFGRLGAVAGNRAKK
jgi:vacuole morphology and inheritance protein 14